MKLICFNVRSLFPKLEEIRSLAVDTKPHLIGLVETWLNDSIDTQELEIPNYKLYRKDWNRFGGGVAVFVRDTVDHKILLTDSMNKVESIWLEIKLPSTRPLIISYVYRPPDNEAFFEDFPAILDDVTNMYNSRIPLEITCMGDLKADYLTPSSSHWTKLKQFFIIIMNLIN